MRLATYLQILRYRSEAIWIVALSTILVAVVGRAQIPARYESSAIVRVVPYSTGNPTNTQVAYANRIMKTYVEIGLSSVIMSSVREQLGLAPNQPASVRIEIISDTELLRITVADPDPVLARDVAMALAGYLINDNAIRDVSVILMEPASIAEPPSRLSVIFFYALAAVVGVLGGVTVALVLENLSPRVYDEKQAEEITSLPVLGSIPSIPLWQARKLVAERFPWNQAFQRLRVTLQSKVQGGKTRSIMVTSPDPREGKSAVAANLALSLARAGYKTVLVDMDLYCPTMHHYFPLQNKQGLTNFLFSNAPVEMIVNEPSLLELPVTANETVQDGREGISHQQKQVQELMKQLSNAPMEEFISPTDVPELSVITHGTMPSGSEGFSLKEKQIEQLIKHLTQYYDYVILDTPAFVGVADTMMLSTLVDGVLLVTRLGQTRQIQLKTTCRELAEVSAVLLGLIIVETTRNLPTRHYKSSMWKQRRFETTGRRFSLYIPGWARFFASRVRLSQLKP